MIGVIGGRGDVGRHATSWLCARDVAVKVGGRTAPDGTAHGVRTQTVDFRDDDSVRAFLAGCVVLVNCAGPSSVIGDRLATAAVRAGIDYVDAAGEDIASDPAGRTLVLGAGLQPGLTGLFTRLVAGSACRQLSVHFGLRDEFTPVAARDYLRATAIPLAAWRGRPRARVSHRDRTPVPFFPGEPTVLPQLDREAERIAATLGLRTGDWYSVVCGEHVLAAFDRVHTMPEDEAVAMLCRASRLDLVGHKPFVTLVVRADDRAAVLTGVGNAALTGAVAGFAALAVSRGEVPAGRHFATDVLDPAAAVSALGEFAQVTWTGSAETVEEGVL